jgi:PRTRC genetic system protein C
MSIKISTPTRVIRWKNRDLADLNPNATVEAVVRMHAATPDHAELATASIEGPEIKDGKAIYTVQSRLGTKG